ncbi:unnamed protein product [Boreogadus saida]
MPLIPAFIWHKRRRYPQPPAPPPPSGQGHIPPPGRRPQAVLAVLICCSEMRAPCAGSLPVRWDREETRSTLLPATRLTGLSGSQQTQSEKHRKCHRSALEELPPGPGRCHADGRPTTTMALLF